MLSALFVGSDSGGEHWPSSRRSSTHRSSGGIDPLAYFTDTLTKIVKRKPEPNDAAKQSPHNGFKGTAGAIVVTALNAQPRRQSSRSFAFDPCSSTVLEQVQPVPARHRSKVQLPG